MAADLSSSEGESDVESSEEEDDTDGYESAASHIAVARAVVAMEISQKDTNLVVYAALIDK